MTIILRTLTILLLAVLLVPAWGKNAAADGPIFASAEHSAQTLEMAGLVLHGVEISQPRALLAPMAEAARQESAADPLARYLAALTAATAEQAQRELESAYWLAASSPSPERLFLKAQCLRGRGESAAAVSLLTRLAGERPYDRLVLMALGEALLEDGQAARAYLHLEEARRLDPDTSRVYLLLGQSHLAGGQTQLASRAFRAALQRMHPQADPAPAYGGLIAAALSEDPSAADRLIGEYLERCGANPWTRDPWASSEDAETPLGIEVEETLP